VVVAVREEAVYLEEVEVVREEVPHLSVSVILYVRAQVKKIFAKSVENTEM